MNEKPLSIRGEMITLGQLVKLMGYVSTGGDVKDLLAKSRISVNGEPDNRRGRKLFDGDVIVLPNEEVVRIVAQK